MSNIEHDLANILDVITQHARSIGRAIHGSVELFDFLERLAYFSAVIASTICIAPRLMMDDAGNLSGLSIAQLILIAFDVSM